MLRRVNKLSSREAFQRDKMNLGVAPDSLGLARAPPSFTSVASMSLLPSLLFHTRWHAKLFAILMLMTISSSTQCQIMDIDVTVAKDGSGNFSTIQEAIDHAPNFSPTRYKIYISEGFYNEYISVLKRKPNLTLVGAGMDKTIISGNKSYAGIGNSTTYQTATAGIEGPRFVACDITFQNIAGPANRAVALRVEANQSAFYRCRFRGYQDTLYTKQKSQFFRECEIYGTVDFICGDSSVVFQNCILYALKPLENKKNTITAQKRETPNDKTGIIIHNSTIIAAEDLHQQGPNLTTFLGRPWGIYSRTVIMESFLDDLINPKGWLEWEGRDPSTLDKVDYAEYANRGPGANTVGRVPWARVINSSSEANKYTVRNFIQGDTWIPAEIPYFLDLMLINRVYT